MTTVTPLEIFVLAWCVRAVGALVLLALLLAATVALVRYIARRTGTLGYLWRAAWALVKADVHQREALRVAALRSVPHPPGVRPDEDELAPRLRGSRDA